MNKAIVIGDTVVKTEHWSTGK